MIALDFYKGLGHGLQRGIQQILGRRGDSSARAGEMRFVFRDFVIAVFIPWYQYIPPQRSSTMRFHRLGTISAVLVVLLALPVFAQRRAERFLPSEDEDIRPVRGEGRGEEAVPPPPIPDGAPAAIPGLQVDAPKTAPPEWVFNPTIDFAFLPEWAQKRNAAVGEIDLSAPMKIPLGGDTAPLRVNPVFGQRFWAGPKPIPNWTLPAADVPGALYEFYVQISWRAKLAEWFYLDMRFTPGYFTDMHNTSSDAFMPRGYVMAIFAFSEQFQFLIGAAATNRVISQAVPIGGFLYTPDEDTEVRLVFHVPRVATVIDKQGNTKYWAHLSGEWGGGAWAVERGAGFNDKLDYSDARVYAGIESQTNGVVMWHAEIGFVFDRILSYKSNLPEKFRLGDTFIARIGFSY
jgi:hypothetical protein